MPIVSMSPSDIFDDWPKWEEYPPPELLELLLAVQSFTDTVNKSNLSDFVALILNLSTCLNNVHSALMRSALSGITYASRPFPSYALWLDHDHIVPLRTTIENFLVDYNQHVHDEQSAQRTPSPLRHVLSRWARLYGKIMQLQYVLQNRPAPCLVDKAEQSCP